MSSTDGSNVTATCTVKINQTETITDANGNKITVPGGFEILEHGTQNENIDEVIYNYADNHKPCVQDGIVIADDEDNQFVWIPVGDIKNKDGSTTNITLGRYTFDRTNGTPKLEQTADNYTQIVKVNGEGGNCYQELINNSGNTAAKNLGDFVNKTKAARGYYLARYEASRGTDNKAKSQYNKKVWNKITQPNAAIAARNMYDNSYVESDLINSYSWNTAIVFIQKYSGNTNYANQTAKKTGTNCFNTGLSGDRVCNIHDMASNCMEWSTEHSIYTEHTGSYEAVRYGGSYSGGYTAWRHYDGYSSNYGYAFATLRMIIYAKL